MNEGTKIAIIGAGHVGCTCAYTLATSGLVRELVLIDNNRERAEGEAMDIAHSVAFRATVHVAAGNIDDTAGAALTVITAGAAQNKAKPARNYCAGMLRCCERLSRFSSGPILMASSLPPIR